MNTENLVLRPNCLLTRFPLVFVTGPRSLFHHSLLCASLQDYLAAHGYVVRSPVLPFRSKIAREFHLRRWLGNQPENRFHFVLGETTFKEFSKIFAEFPDSTFTRLPRDFPAPPTAVRLSYQLHRFFCAAFGTETGPYSETLPDQSTGTLDRFLDHCIELAENELV